MQNMTKIYENEKSKQFAKPLPHPSAQDDQELII